MSRSRIAPGDAVRSWMVSPNACTTDLSFSVCSARRRRWRMDRDSPPLAVWSSFSRWLSACERRGAISRMNRNMNAADTATQKRTSSTWASDLDVDDLADPEEPDELEDHSHHHQELPQGIREQQHDVRRVERVHRRAHGDREHREHVPAEAALGRVDPKLPAD